jgi:hypothetical protein
MSPAPDHDFDLLAADWQSLDAPGPARDAIHEYVRSRTRALKILAAGELLVVVVALSALAVLGAATTNTVDRIVILSLAVVAIVAELMSWLNWRDVLHATDRTTAEFVELSVRRLRRMRNAYAAGWVLLLVEVAVLATWIVYRASPGDGRSTAFAWSLLAVLTTLAVVFQLGFRRWVLRDERRLAERRSEFED